MPTYVPDITSRRWMIFSENRWDRPDDHAHPHIGAHCAFCPGNEGDVPDEVMRVPDEDGRWKIRVVHNKYPISDIHEVVIHSPDHERDLTELGSDHMRDLLMVYQHRYHALSRHGRVMIFCNHGEHAGASLMHPHSQIVVLPKHIRIDDLSKEPISNVVEERGDIVSYCPDFSQWPYEVWISSKGENNAFEEMKHDCLNDVSLVIFQVLRKLKKKCAQIHQKTILKDGIFSYNYYIHPGPGWFLRIIPRFIHRAGFEIATGISVNMVESRVASRELRIIKV